MKREELAICHSPGSAHFPQTTIALTPLYHTTKILSQEYSPEEASSIGPWHLLGCAAADAEIAWGVEAKPTTQSPTRLAAESLQSSATEVDNY